MLYEKKVDRIFKDVILDIPIEYGFKKDEELFKLPPIQKKRVPRQNFPHHIKFFKVASQSKKPITGYDSPLYKFSSKGGSKNQAVVIKNIGNMSAKHLRNALYYAVENSRDKMLLTDDYSQLTVREVLRDWSADFNTSNEKSNEAMHLVFSIQEIPSDQNMQILLNSVYDTLRENFSDYKFALIAHTHQNNPHIHAIINKTNQITLKKFHHSDKMECKEFFNKLRNDFCETLALYSQNTLSHNYVNSVNYSDYIPSKSECERLKNEPLQDPASFDFQKLVKSMEFAFIRDRNLKKEKLRRLREKLEKEQDRDRKSSLEIEIQKTSSDLDKVYKDYESNRGWAITFDDYFKNISTLEKDEKILNQLSKFKNKRLTQSILLDKKRLEDSVYARKLAIKDSIFPLTDYITTTLSPSLKSNAFNLYKHQRRIRRLQFLAKNYLENAEELKEVTDGLKMREEEIREIIKGREVLVSEKLFEEKVFFKELEKNMMSLISNGEVHNQEFEVLSRDYIKSARKIRFLLKEKNLIQDKTFVSNIEELGFLKDSIEESREVIKQIDSSLKNLENNKVIEPVFENKNENVPLNSATPNTTFSQSPSPIPQKEVRENQDLEVREKTRNIKVSKINNVRGRK